MKPTGTELELEDLKMKVREYLKRPSSDGRSDRQQLRKELAELTKEIK